MTIFSQSAINLVAQFVEIVLKILAAHLRNRAKFFLDDVEVKRPKIKYNNEELALEIRRYVFKYIQNLDMVLVDLE